MAKTNGSNFHTIDGNTYVEVDRKPTVGDYVIYPGLSTLYKVNHLPSFFGNRECLTIVWSEFEEIVGYKASAESLKDFIVVAQDTPPIELTANDIRWQPDKVIDLLANLARRVSSLEEGAKNYATHPAVNKVGEEIEELAERIQRNFNGLETQVRDTQRNVERQAEEIAELKHLTESNEEDIRTLDERTQPKPHVVDAFPSNAKLLAEAFAALAKYENGGKR